MADLFSDEELDLDRRREEADSAYQDSLFLQTKAVALGIEIPENWWTSDEELLRDERRLCGRTSRQDARSYMTGDARSRLRFLIDEARVKRDIVKLERLHKRIGIFAQIAAILFGLIGALIGLIALLKR